MKKILQIKGKGKVKKAKAVEIMDLEKYGAMGIDSKAALIHELIPLGLMHIEDLLQREIIELAGERYKRNGLLRRILWISEAMNHFPLDFW
jgi:hypothetical protein